MSGLADSRKEWFAVKTGLQSFRETLRMAVVEHRAT